MEESETLCPGGLDGGSDDGGAFPLFSSVSVLGMNQPNCALPVCHLEIRQIEALCVHRAW